MTESNKELNLQELKEEATKLGVEFAPNVTAATLKKRIDKFIVDNATEEPPEGEKALTKNELIAKIRKESKRKVRVRVSCLNPNKKDWRGEFITSGNNFVGDVKEFVPFNAQENGWHVYQATLDVLKERKFQNFIDKKSKHGITQRKGVLQQEFNIELLPPLTKKELEALKASQKARPGDFD